MILKDSKAILVGLKHTEPVTTRYRRHARPFDLNLTLDFSCCSIKQVLAWAHRNRVITFQRMLRSHLTEETFEAFMESGPDLAIFAIDAHRVLEEHRTMEEIINEIREQI